MGKLIYNQGFFNVGLEHSDMFGADNTTIDIKLSSSGDTTIQGYINRTANKNRTPRILGGKEFSNWIENNFKPNDKMKVDIFSPIAVRLN